MKLFSKTWSKKDRFKIMFKIFETQIIKTVVYSIASVDLTAADKGALDNILVDAVRTALQWTEKWKEDNTWVILEQT